MSQEWDFSTETIAKAKELAIGDRVAVHWSEAECQNQEGTVVGVDIERHGRVSFAVHIDGDISPTDGFYIDISGHDSGSIRPIKSLAPAGGGEVVAWQSKLGPSGQWVVDPLALDPDFRAKSEAAGAEFRPLYASPPAAPSKVVEGEAVERVAIALFRYDFPQDKWERFGQKDYHPERYRMKARVAIEAALGEAP